MWQEAGVSRALFNANIEQLETLAACAAAKADVQALEALRQEMDHRKTLRARGLREMVARALAQLQGRVFIRDAPEDMVDEGILHVGDYVPARTGAQDDHSRAILRLKDGVEGDIRHFVELLDPEIAEHVAIACVPSHDPWKPHSGIRELARVLASRNGRQDATSAVVRRYKIHPLKFGGDRSLEHQLESLATQHAELVYGRSVLLLDDVTTSGNSLRASRGRLLEAGAFRVKMLALAQTRRA